MTELRVSKEPSPAIICLLGTARSGSTLLQRMVELNSNAIGLGELSRVHELLERQSACACGEKLAACAFWASALQDLRQMAPSIAWSNASWLERSTPVRGALATMTGLHFLASPKERDSARALEGALASLAKKSGASAFIDTSKDPAEFLRLALMPAHRIVPVHLIRDPRAVAWSGFHRTGADPIAMATHWARLNRAIVWLRRLTRRFPWQTVRYEDFCANPNTVSRTLLAVAGTTAGSGHPKATHAMGGSPGFSLNSGDSIALDDRWRVEMPDALQRDIMRAIGGTARRFGYT